MHSSPSSIHSLVTEIKKSMFSLSEDEDFCSFVSPSAYDTAWVAMIPDQSSNEPMFKSCLSWILGNQTDGGFWGEALTDGGDPTIDALPATLACLIALEIWKVGGDNINKGLEFMNRRTEIILKENKGNLPKWFLIVFPAMVDLALSKGLPLIVPQLSDVLSPCQQLDQNTQDDDWWLYNSPLLSNLECLPSSYHGNLVQQLSEDGSLFQSPSATAKAFMLTRNTTCFNYLTSLVHKCPNGVPAKYPVDVELTKLSMVDHVQRLGLAEHFTQEIHHILQQIYRNNLGCQDLEKPMQTHILPTKLYKDALGFRLLRMEGYPVQPSSFCWFLQNTSLTEHVERNCVEYASLLYVVFRATNLMFNGEYDAAEAQSFSRKLLEKSISITKKNVANDGEVIFSGLQKLIQQELEQPWIARLDHLDHRTWIEETKNNSQWIGNASYYELFTGSNEKLMQLACENYEHRQSIYANELEQLKRWSMDSGLTNIGFGREKTIYTYFGMAASTCLPHNSIVRILGAKIAVLVTIADDFYDVEGHFTELEILTDAVQRWNGKDLEGHNKTIFDALDDLVQTTSLSYHHSNVLERANFMEVFKDIWKETFQTWMVERSWSTTGYQPSMNEYLDTGMISTAAHTITLPSSCFLDPNSTVSEIHKPGNYRDITKLLMAIARLLNDTQSYQREDLDGKMNMVLLHLKENPEFQIHDSIAYVRGIVDEKTRQLLQIVLTNHNNMPNDKAFMTLHLSCVKVFYMLFSTSNRFDTKEDLMDDINKAIYIPPHRNLQNLVLHPWKNIEKFKSSKPMAKLIGFRKVAPKEFKINVLSICGGRSRSLSIPLKF